MSAMFDHPCCQLLFNLINHFELRHAGRDVSVYVSFSHQLFTSQRFPPSTASYLHMVHIWASAQSTEVVIWWEEHMRKCGGHFCPVWLIWCWQRDGLRNKCVWAQSAQNIQQLWLFSCLTAQSAPSASSHTSWNNQNSLCSFEHFKIKSAFDPKGFTALRNKETDATYTHKCKQNHL